MPIAKTAVPTPMAPPSAMPMTSTVTSIDVRAKRIEIPRFANPVIRPSRWARAEPGADVETGTDCDHHDATQHHGGAGHEQVGFRQQRQHHIDDEADLDRVEDRAEAHRLAERNPQQQQQDARDDRHLADGEPGQLGDAGVEHVPRCRAQVGVDQEGDADTEDGEPEDTPHDALHGSVGGNESMHRGTLTITDSACDERGECGGLAHRTGDLVLDRIRRFGSSVGRRVGELCDSPSS